MYSIHRQTAVETDLEKAWAFISNPRNLNLITPDNMAFQIVSELPEAMFNGLLIEYRVRLPLLGHRPWVSEIKHIREGKSFVDEQREGPYQFWYHYHEIYKTDKGVLFIDEVKYRLPFGWLAAPVQRFFVADELRRIFDYRESAVKRYFSS